MKKTFTMHLADEPFASIKNKTKTIEIRLNDKKRQEIKVGDILIFYNLSGEDNFLVTKVKEIYAFNSFKSLFSSQLFPLTGCGNMTVDEATESMYRYYSREQEAENGVLGIGIELDECLTKIYSTLKKGVSADVFDKLMSEYKEFLTQEQVDDLMSIACEFFEKNSV